MDAKSTLYDGEGHTTHPVKIEIVHEFESSVSANDPKTSNYNSEETWCIIEAITNLHKLQIKRHKNFSDFFNAFPGHAASLTMGASRT